jgi:hypothetical protein
METYTLVVNSQYSDLIKLTQLIGRQKKNKVIIFTEHNTNEISQLMKLGFRFYGPSLIITSRLGERPFQIDGEKEIIKFLREEQFKITV